MVMHSNDPVARAITLRQELKYFSSLGIYLIIIIQKVVPGSEELKYCVVKCYTEQGECKSHISYQGDSMAEGLAQLVTDFYEL